MPHMLIRNDGKIFPNRVIRDCELPFNVQMAEWLYEHTQHNRVRLLCLEYIANLTDKSGVTKEFLCNHECDLILEKSDENIGQLERLIVSEFHQEFTKFEVWCDNSSMFYITSCSFDWIPVIQKISKEYFYDSITIFQLGVEICRFVEPENLLEVVHTTLIDYKGKSKRVMRMHNMLKEGSCISNLITKIPKLNEIFKYLYGSELQSIAVSESQSDVVDY